MTRRSVAASLLGATAIIIAMPRAASSQQTRRPNACNTGSYGYDAGGWPERLRRGDTIGVARDIAHVAAFCPAEMTTLAVLLPFLRDSAHAALLGLGDLPYENIIWRLAKYPVAVEGDTGELSCTPDACELLKRQWQEATDPRLRDVALVALMAANPARWADTIISLAERERGDELLRDPAARLRGVYSSSVGAMPMPRPDANWHQWLVWARGIDPPNRPGAPPDFATWAGDREQGVRLFQLRTGRDFVTEWRADLAAAPNDTARYLFETLLAPWRGWDPPAVSVIEAQLRHGDALNYARAELAISEMFRRNGGPADARTATAITDTLLAMIIDRKPLWPALPPEWDPRGEHTFSTGDWPSAGPRTGSVPQTLFAFVADLPPQARKRWNGRVTWVADSTSRIPAGQSPTTLIRIESLQQAGPFLKVQGSVDSYRPDAVRTNEPSFMDPRYTHKPLEALLLRTGGRWVIVPTIDAFW
jgi:hypothetical protein